MCLASFGNKMKLLSILRTMFEAVTLTFSLAYLARTAE